MSDWTLPHGIALEIIEAETLRLERLVGDLLELAKLQSGGGGLRRERVSVSALFERVVARHEQQSQARGHRIVIQVGPSAEFVEGIPIGSNKHYRT